MKTIQIAKVNFELAYGTPCELTFHEATPEEIAENIKKLYSLFHPVKNEPNKSQKRR